MFEALAAEHPNPARRMAGPISVVIHAAAATAMILAALWRVGEPGEPPVVLPALILPTPSEILVPTSVHPVSSESKRPRGPDALTTRKPFAEPALPRALPLSQDFSVGVNDLPARVTSGATATSGPGSGTPDGVNEPAPCTFDCRGDAIAVGVNHVVPPTLLFQPSPPYPESMRHLRTEGAVLLRAVIGLDGDVEDLRVERADSQLFADAAVAAVSRWRYKPATLNGRRVRVFLDVAVNFRLQ